MKVEDRLVIYGPFEERFNGILRDIEDANQKMSWTPISSLLAFANNSIWQASLLKSQQYTRQWSEIGRANLIFELIYNRFPQEIVNEQLGILE